MNTEANKTALPFPAAPEDDGNPENVWQRNPGGVGGALCSAGWAIFQCGLYGIWWGAVAGGIVGTCFFPVLGTVIGAICGMPLGFIAGIVGGMIGGRWGGAAGGAVGGIGGGITLCAMFNLNRVGENGYQITSLLLIFAVLALPSLAGWFWGYCLGRHLEADAPEHGSVAGNLNRKLIASGLYCCPWWARVFVGMMVILSIVALVAHFRAWGQGGGLV